MLSNVFRQQVGSRLWDAWRSITLTGANNTNITTTRYLRFVQKADDENHNSTSSGHDDQQHFAQSLPSLAQHLRTAHTSYELFEIVSLKRKEFDPEHVMHALKRLFHLQKNENTSIQNKHVLRNPDFEHLCRNLKQASRHLNVNDLIEAMKILNFVGVPPNSDISMTLLHLVRNQINDITLGQIVFLEFLMRKFEPTPLVQAFRLALPMLMQIQLAAKLDHENTGQLTDLLLFATRNPLSEQARMNIVSALTLHGTALTLEQAHSIVWSLCDLDQFTATHERLLHNALEVLCDQMTRLSFDVVETTLSKMVQRYQGKRGTAAFYDEEFYGRCAQYVLDKDVGAQNALYVQRKFNRVNYVSIPLIEYVADKMCAEPDVWLADAKQNALLTYVSALSTAAYRPLAWDSLVPFLRRNAIVAGTGQEPAAAMPWLRFVLELFALDVRDDRLMDMISADGFLRQQLHRTNNILEMLHVLLLHQVVELLMPGYAGQRVPDDLVKKAREVYLQRQDVPLRACVERIFGADGVRSAVVTRFGHFIDHLVVFDAEGQVVRLDKAETVDALGHFNYEDVRLAAGQRVVAVCTYPQSHYCLNVPRLKGLFVLRTQTLQQLLGADGAVCVINDAAWAAMPDREKLDFVEREIRQKLAE